MKTVKPKKLVYRNKTQVLTIISVVNVTDVEDHFILTLDGLFNNDDIAKAIGDYFHSLDVCNRDPSFKEEWGEIPRKDYDFYYTFHENTCSFIASNGECYNAIWEFINVPIVRES